MAHRGITVGAQSCDADVPHAAAVPDIPSTSAPDITVTTLSTLTGSTSGEPDTHE